MRKLELFLLSAIILVIAVIEARKPPKMHDFNQAQLEILEGAKRYDAMRHRDSTDEVYMPFDDTPTGGGVGLSPPEPLTQLAAPPPGETPVRSGLPSP